MHTYTLHYPVTAECLCCHLHTTFTFKSPSDHVVCAGCRRHQGDAKAMLQLRDADHINLWWSELELEREARTEEQASLTATIAQRDQEITHLRELNADLRGTIKNGIRSRPVETVADWFRDEAIIDAHRERDGAYRSRDHALRIIWNLDKLHHGPGPKCSCGKTTAQCRDWQRLDEIREWLYKWERKQVVRLKQGHSHGLPDDHPEVIKIGHQYSRLYG